MMRRVVSAFVFAMSLAVVLSASSSHAQTKKKSAPAKAESYAVVRIGDEVKVVQSSELANLNKKTAEEDKRLMKAYEEAKKNPRRDMGNVELVKPSKRKVTILKKNIKNREDAQDWQKKYEEEGDAKESKTAKKASDW